MLISAVIALAASAPPQGASQPPGGFLMQLAPFILIGVVFYFLLIRPTQRRQKEHAALVAALKPGDKVVCAGGIHATVVGVSDGMLQVKIADQVRIDVDKSSVTTVKTPNG
jgi:preprotein translocase subunit YajC